MKLLQGLVNDENLSIGFFDVLPGMLKVDRVQTNSKKGGVFESCVSKELLAFPDVHKKQNGWSFHSDLLLCPPSICLELLECLLHAEILE